VEAGAGGCEGEASSCGACADYGYGADNGCLRRCGLRGDCLVHLVLVTAVMTDS
jgi:hypothetical protein